MPYIGQKPADIISTAVDTVTGTFSGDIDASTVNATGDTAAGDNAAIGFTSAEGLILTGQGSTNDVTIKNDADADVIEIPTGTVNVTMAGTLGVVGAVTANAGVVVDNITIDGTEIDLSSGDLTVDVAGDIILDADGAQIRLSDNGTQFGLFGNENSDLSIQSSIQDKDMIFQGNDGGAGVTALTLDMSDAGTAIFNHDIKISANAVIDCAGNLRLDAESANIVLQDTGTVYGTFFKSGSNFRIRSDINDADIIFNGYDGGSEITALTFDMSENARASFKDTVDIPGIIVQGSIGSGGIARQTTASGSHAYVPDKFRNSSGTEVGSIGVGTSATSFNTSSDYRLKENVSYSFDATTRLKQLKPARFNFITDADTTVDGFIAHEVSSIVPEAITGAKDDTESMANVVLNADGTWLTDGVSENKWTEGKLSTTDEDGNTIDPIYASDTTWVASQTVPKYQSIDQAKLVPLLTKALQEQQTTIEALTARIVTLENA